MPHATDKKYIYGNIFIKISDRHHFKAALLGVIAGVLPFAFIYLQETHALSLGGRMFYYGNEPYRDAKWREAVDFSHLPIQTASYDLDSFQKAYKAKRLEYRDGWNSVTGKK